MTWTKREAVTNLVVLGDGEGQKKKVGGLLIGTPADRGYPDKVNYELVQRDGEVHLLSGSASLARQIGVGDIGKFIKCEFAGWGKSANGKFKAIDVFVFDGEPTEDMKKWPLYAETVAKLASNSPQRTHAKATAKAPAGGQAGDDFADFPGALNDEDDDLPF